MEPPIPQDHNEPGVTSPPQTHREVNIYATNVRRLRIWKEDAGHPATNEDCIVTVLGDQRDDLAQQDAGRVYLFIA